MSGIELRIEPGPGDSVYLWDYSGDPNRPRAVLGRGIETDACPPEVFDHIAASLSAPRDLPAETPWTPEEMEAALLLVRTGRLRLRVAQ